MAWAQLNLFAYGQYETVSTDLIIKIDFTDPLRVAEILAVLLGWSPFSVFIFVTKIQVYNNSSIRPITKQNCPLSLKLNSI